MSDLQDTAAFKRILGMGNDMEAVAKKMSEGLSKEDKETFEKELSKNGFYDSAKKLKKLKTDGFSI